jgi:hypothetical protein
METEDLEVRIGKRKVVFKSVTMEFTMKDGSTLQRTLKGKDAQEWDKMMLGVCLFATNHRANPDWEKLKWIEKVIPKRSRA